MKRLLSVLLIFILVYGVLPTQKTYAATVTFTRAENTNATGYGTWTVPAGVTSADFACWGGGAGGVDAANGTGGGGGGGGAFASTTRNVTPGAIFYFYIAAQVGETTNGQDSIATTTNSTVVLAAGGDTGSEQTQGAGGLASASIGTTTRNGGNGGTGTTGTADAGGGGGGAAGPHAVGGEAADVSGNVGTNGAQGDGTFGGTGGSGGDGVDGQPGNADVDGGGGGGGGDNGTAGGNGAIPGGGGGGAEGNGGLGASGQCIVTYTSPITAPTVTTGVATLVTASSMTLNATIDTLGGENANARGFASSTNSLLVSGVATTTEAGDFGTGAFTGLMGGLTGNTTYYFRAFAGNTGGTGYGLIGSQLTFPGQPTSIIFSGTTATTTGISWTAASGGAATYRMAQCSGSCTQFSGITNTSTTTYSLVGNTSYVYQVQGVNATGNGAWAASSTRLTLPDRPGTPSFSSVLHTTMSVSWSAPTGGASSYKIERCTGSNCTNFSELATGVSSPYADTGLTALTTYRYRVRATNATGDGLYSGEAQQQTNPTPVSSVKMSGGVIKITGGTLRLR